MRSLKCRHKNEACTHPDPPCQSLSHRVWFRDLSHKVRDLRPEVPAPALADVKEAVGQDVCFCRLASCLHSSTYLFDCLFQFLNLHIYLLYVCVF